MNCEVCGHKSLTASVNFGQHPLCDDLINPATPHISEVYTQEVFLCPECLTAHQRYPVRKETLFGPRYHYRSRLTNDVLSGMDELVRHSLALRAPKLGDKVLDIGCNDGSLLAKFSEMGLETFGVDPTNAILEHAGAVDHPYMDYFDSDFASDLLRDFGTFEYITLTNVFAHIEDFQNLCRAIEVLIGPDTVVVIENHYLGSILEKSQFDTFYHEHPRTYSASSFRLVSEKLASQVVDISFPKRYGGNIRVSLSRDPSLSTPDAVFPDEEWMFEAFLKLEDTYLAWKENTRVAIEELARQGAVAGKALPGRAVMLISSLGLDESVMPEVFEKADSPKVGMLVPGTRIAISSDDGLQRSEYSDLVIWAWHISDEVADYVRGLGFKGRLWTPMPLFEQVAGQSLRQV
jgi:SAM-dependent methyltransferase